MPSSPVIGVRHASIPNPLSTSGSATLRVDRESVPHLRRVFDGALSKLDAQIEMAMTGIRVAPWAGDPVSEDAASSFNDASVDGPDSALTALRAYQHRLKSASDALSQVAQEYQIVEDDNAGSFRGTDGGC